MTGPLNVTAQANPAILEATRAIGICNSCRYCEGFCAVFPAMERRLTFTPTDMHYLANLCHNCGSCYHACQYAPPHEFMVNIPKALADVRLETYSHFTTPSSLSGLYKNQGVAFALASTLALMMITSLVIYSLAGSLDKLFQATTDRSLFYEITSHGFLVSLFLPVFGLSILMMARSGHKYWKALTTLPAESTQIVSEAQSTFLDATTLRYLGGGGDGCPSENDHPSMRRRFSHQLIFYGFLLCLLSTSVATAYHYLLNWPAPYPMLSVPKVLGTVGGVMMVLGCSLTALNRRSRHTSLKSPDQRSLDIGFVTVLFLVAFSGLLSMLFRATAAMPLLHIFHLSTVMTFFLLMPYSKFMHSTYRLLALWWHNREQLNSRDTHLHES